MITRIEALNYRCFRYISQELGNFHILAGPNASGKSTFLDVIALISDVLNDGPLEAVRKRAPDYRDLFWMGQGESFEVAIEAEIPGEVRKSSKYGNYGHCRYELRIGTVPDSGEIGILDERLQVFKARPSKRPPFEEFPRMKPVPESLFQRKSAVKPLVERKPDGGDYFRSESQGHGLIFHLGPQKSGLGNLPDDVHKFPISVWFKSLIRGGIQLLALDSKVLRLPCPPGMPKRLQADGSNLPWLIHDLTRTAGRLGEWVDHVRTALPNILAVVTVERPEDRHRYLVLRYENGLEIPSWVVSDGTLRFLALTLLPYLLDMRGTYMIEEPENGIHPRGIEAVYQSLSSVYEGQVLVATHSPIFLTISEPSQVLCFAMTEKDEAVVIEGSRHSRLRDWRNQIALGDLFAAGVLG